MSQRQSQAQTDSADLEGDVSRGPLNWSAVLAAAALAGLQLYEGIGPAWAGDTPAAPSLFLGGLLLAWIVVFFTHYWRPPLYLLGALVGLYVLVVWLLGGMSLALTSLATAGSATLLVVLCLASGYREQVAYLSDRPDHSTRR